MAAVNRVVPEELDGARADLVVAKLAGVSREAARRLIKLGVMAEGRPVEGKDRLTAGWSLQLPEGSVEEATEWIGPEVPIVYVDDDMMVVDKPAGLVVHVGAGHSGPTLASVLLGRFPELEGVGEPERWGLVHRLDRDTSGLLLVARTERAHHRLRAQLSAREVKRRYLALAHGAFDLPSGTIDAPIERDPHRPTRRRVGSAGRPARTHYRVVESFPGATLLEVDLDTGRTHQIRVHLAAIDHPLIGDRGYTRRNDPVEVPRIFLHAFQLSLQHPTSGDLLELEAPLPGDLLGVLSRLRAISG
jgi:23S rRNA pseudouridine1911/1915/1917 synthase